MSTNYSPYKAPLKHVTVEDFERFLCVLYQNVPYGSPFFGERFAANYYLKSGSFHMAYPRMCRVLPFRSRIFAIVINCTRLEDRSKRSEVYVNYIYLLFKATLEDLLLHINSKDLLVKAIVTWRLSVGK
jgi:hypothetical protein